MLLVALAAIMFVLFASIWPRLALAQEAPVLDSISPPQADPGTEVTLYGSGFGDTQVKKSGVEFAWHKAADIMSWSDTEIVAVVPARAEDGYVHVTVDGVDSNEIWFIASAPELQPRLDSLSTYMAPPGTDVTFYGENFGPKKTSSYPTFAGVRGQVKSWSDTEIVATVPNGAESGWAGVVVDGIASNGLYFVPHDPPVVTALDKVEGLPGDTVTITGTDFGKKQESGWVTFAGTPGGVVSWSDTEIVATVPDGADAGYVGVVQNGIVSNGIFFIPFAHPAVTSVTPEYVLVGDTVTIAGQNFGDEPDTVVVGGVPIVPDTWTDTEVTFTVPETTTQGYAGVQRDGVTSNGVFITIAPRVDALSIWWTEPGGTVAIRGVGFGDGSDGWAGLNGQPVPVVSWSPDEVVVTIPEGSASGFLGVVRRDWATSNGEYLVVQTPATITGVDAAIVTPGQEITIDGTDFGPAATTSVVTIAGEHECAVVSWSDTRIVARVPDGVGPGYLGVYKEGVSSNGIWLEANVPDPPQVDSISAWWGLPGDAVTFTGSGFGDTQGSGYPVFAGTPAIVVSWSDTEVVATVPAGAATGYAGIVQNGITSNGVFFMPHLPPSISAVSTDTASPGDTITVTGEGFRDAPGLLTVGGVEVTPTSWTATEITFEVPVGLASGYVGITHDDVISNGVWLEIVP
jgi:signal peptidase I